MVPAGRKVRGVLTKFGSDYQLLASFRKDVVITAPSSLFFSPKISKPDKTNLSLPGWTNIAQSGKTFWDCVFRNGYAEFNTEPVLSNVAWLISPKIDMDTHQY
jgi:hypothetical protein